MIVPTNRQPELYLQHSALAVWVRLALRTAFRSYCSPLVYGLIYSHFGVSNSPLDSVVVFGAEAFLRTS